jgi:hypothetical protein
MHVTCKMLDHEHISTAIFLRRIGRMGSMDTVICIEQHSVIWFPVKKALLLEDP